jgi:hypothetical protein
MVKSGFFYQDRAINLCVQGCSLCSYDRFQLLSCRSTVKKRIQKARHTEVDHIHSIAILSTEQKSRVNIKHSAINSGKGIYPSVSPTFTRKMNTSEFASRG